MLAYSEIMKNLIFLVLTFIIILDKKNVKAQAGINDLDATDILNQIEQICKIVNNTIRDDICFKQLTIVCQNETFQTRMMDANSKYPYSGMLVKTKLDLGNYDECIELDLTRNKTRVLGKHCTGGIIIPTTLLNDSKILLEQAYKLSTCIPDRCTAMDLLELLNLSYVYPLFNDLSCSTKESQAILGWDDYAVTTFFVSIFLVMIAATIYDLYFYYISTDCPNILLQAFSMVHNGKKLLKVSKTSNDQIKVIHGLRVISMMWIILAHSFVTILDVPGNNVDNLTNFEWTRVSTYITTGHLGVDTFFFISGFLLAYQYLKGKPTSLSNHLRRIPAMIFHRYIRLTPVVASVFLILITVSTHIGNGPIFHDAIQLEKDRCFKHWWSYFTYTQNYVNYDDMCILVTWYLSVDWQLFVISPIILVPVAMLVKSNFKWIMGQLIILNMMFTFLPVALKLLFEDYDNTYETHVRLNDYFIGFMLGVYMREKNNSKFRFSTIPIIVIWIIVLSAMITTIFLYKEIQLLMHSEQDNSYITYFIFLRSVWSLGLAWIIYACHNGYGGFINWLLTTPLVQVLSKLTFCMYLIHGCPLLYMRATIRSPIEYTQITAIKDTIVTYVASVIISIFWTLAFESPVITIEKYFLGN